jgi:probable O-glycosylation ligase (exosortase A-associated)
MLRSLFLSLIFMGVMPLIVLYPHIGVLVWHWCSVFNPHRLAAGFITDFPTLQVLGGLTIVAWLFSSERKLPPNHPIIWTIVLFFTWTCITTVFSVEFDPKYVKFNTFWKIILFTVLTACMFHRRDRLNFLILIIVASIGYYAMRGAFGTIIAGGKYAFEGPPGTFLGDRNSLAVAFVMTIPLLVYISSHLPQKFLRVCALIAIPGFIIAVLGSQSRGGFICLVAMGVWLILRSKRRFIGLAGIAITAALAIGFMPDTWTQRMQTVENFEEDGSMQGRLQMWRYALDLTVDKPIIGGGFRTFANRRLAGGYLPDGIILRASHSIYFEALGEHGIPGLFLYVSIMAAYFFTCNRIIKLTKNRDDLKWASDLGAMLQSSLIGFIVGGGLLEIVVFDIFYTFAVLAMMLHVIVLQTLERGLAKHGAAGKDVSDGFPAEWLIDPAPVAATTQR